MDISPFIVEFEYNGKWILAEIKPCCQENNVHYFDVSINNQFQYTITQNGSEEAQQGWRIALKNADKQFDPNLVKFIGEQIEHHYVV